MLILDIVLGNVMPLVVLRNCDCAITELARVCRQVRICMNERDPLSCEQLLIKSKMLSPPTQCVRSCSVLSLFVCVCVCVMTWGCLCVTILIVWFAVLCVLYGRCALVDGDTIERSYRLAKTCLTRYIP